MTQNSIIQKDIMTITTIGTLNNAESQWSHIPQNSLITLAFEFSKCLSAVTWILSGERGGDAEHTLAGERVFRNRF